jgi:phosphoglycerate dehydrogenase-like enzyme
MPRTILTPHTSGATQAAVMSMFRMLTDNLAAYFAGRPLINPVP